MNNKDILNELQSNGNEFMPSNRLDPTAIEESLSVVKRKSRKGIATACISLAVVCLTVVGFGASMINKYKLPVKTDSTNVSSYDEIYKIVHSVKKANEVSFIEELADEFFYRDVYYESIATQDIVTNNAMSDTKTFGASTNESASPEYSETNIQVKGVDEADVVKTDGEYIYSVNNNKIYITQPNNGTPLSVSSIECENRISDIYIYEDKLVAFSGSYLDPQTNNEVYMYDVEGGYYEDSYYTSTTTKILIYDLSDIKNPVQLSELLQSGQCLSSRKIDNVVYTTTNYSIYDYDSINKSKPETFCPLYGTENNFNCVEAEDVYVAETVEDIEYVVVTSIDLNNPNGFSDICSVMGSGSEIYSSMNNLYVASYCYSSDSYNSTQILRFSLNGTDITENGSLKVDGSLLNQFSMDEYNGFFRVVTEKNYSVSGLTSSSGVNSEETALYVFDSNLELAGKTDDVAKDEQVKSVRFDGDIAYFVTFRQTDPLFTVDLSDPYSPKILSELKIPGFSEYLHPFGDGLLLGFGREADPDTGAREGLKLTMFDTSDKTNVTEIATRIFTDRGVSSSAEYDHKAIFVDEEKGIIGIPYFSYTTENNESHYAIFEYDKEREDFVLCKDIILYSIDGYNYEYNYYDHNEYTRGLYIDDYFYIISLDRIYSFDYNTFEFKSELRTESGSEPTTEPSTELKTEQITEPSTELSTETITELSTELSTETITELNTEQN